MDQALQQEVQSSIPSLEDSLRLGQSIHLEFEGLPTLNGGYHLWGICPNQSIMVSAPQLKLTEELLNTTVKARLFIEQLDSACAFRTTVANLCSSPSNYLHLVMPSSMVTGEVRRNHRARISVSCDIAYGDEKTTSAEMIDASICGCRINTNANDLKVGDAITMVFEVNVYGISKEINLSAMVRSRAETAEGYALGAQFLEMSDCNRIAMNSFIHKHC
jgi:c-di-GMP-binding flagellar brake protein YcgR